MALKKFAKSIKIPVPYGYLTGLEWGSKDGIPVLALHGWQDNAASFQNLAIYLPSNLHIIAIDLPGHGQSSHLPQGSKYSFIQFVGDMRRVVQYLGWTHFNIIGHSRGGRIGLLYASIYNKEVDSIFLLDILYPGIRLQPEEPLDEGIDNFLKEEEHEEKSQHKFSLTDIISLMAVKRKIPEGVALPLAKRGSRPVLGKVVLTRDYRFRVCLQEELRDPEQFYQILRGITTRVCVITATDSHLTRVMPECQEATMNILKTHARELKRVEIEGNHYIHMLKPDEVARYIKEFLLQKNNSHESCSLPISELTIY